MQIKYKDEVKTLMVDKTEIRGIPVCLEIPKKYYLTSFLFELQFGNDIV